METQTITITVTTRGDACEMSDAQIRDWYREQVAALFDGKYGTPDISVDVARKTDEQGEKTYRFYGWESATMKDIHGRTPREYYDLLSDVWCLETCAPRLRKDWSEENKTLGQCSITAFLLQDTFGGRVFGVPLKEGGYHCFNVVDGCVFDLTSEQFQGEVLDYVHVSEQVRDAHFADADKHARYLMLKERLRERME